MKITVLGCGRWATFLGWYANDIGHDVMIWGRESSKNLKKLIETRTNEYLSLDENIHLTDSLQEAVEYSDFLIVSVSSQHLRDLCTNIKQFDLSKKTLILAMKGIEKNTGYRLTQVVKEVVNQDIEFSLKLHTDDVQIYVNRIQLEQIVINLIINAVQAFKKTDKDSKAIIVKTDILPDHVLIIVRDNALGIDPFSGVNLFDPFYSTKIEEEGMGLGLALVKSFIDKMHGTVDYQNNDIGGVDFVVKLEIKN